MTFLAFERITGHEATSEPLGNSVSAQTLCDCDGSGNIFTATEKTLDAALDKLHTVIYRYHCSIVFERQKYRCCDCSRKRPLDPDHVKLRSHGRVDTVENIKGRCRECHDKRHGKGVRPADEQENA